MNENQYVIFKLSDEFYAIKIDTVETIERDMEITRVSKLNDMMVGYIVDATYEVKELLPSSIEYTSVETASASSYVRGIAKDNDRMIILLDVDKVLSV